MRWIRWAIYSVVGLLVFSYVAVIFLLPFLLSTDYAQRRIEESLSSAINRPVEFVPHLQVSWKLNPHLTLGDLHIGNPAGLPTNPPLLVLRSAEARLDTWALVHGGVILPVLRFESGELNLISAENQKNNWTFASAAPDATLPDPKAKPSPLWLPRIDLIDLGKFKVNYINQSSSGRTSGTIDTLTVQKFGSGTAVDIATNAAFNLHAFSLKAQVGSVSDVFQQSDWPVKFQLEYAGQRLVVDGTIDLSHGDAFSLATKAQISGTSLGKVLSDFGVASVPEIPNYKIAGDFSFRNGELRFNIRDSELGSVRFSAEGATSLSKPAPNGTLTASISGDNLSSILEGFGVQSMPPVNEFKVNGFAEAADGLLKVRIDDASFDDLLIRLNLTHPMTSSEFRGEISAENLDLANLLPKTEEEETPKSKAESKYLFSESPIDLSFLQDRLVNIDLNLKNFAPSPELHFTQLSGNLQIQEGELKISALSAQADQGTINGDFSLGGKGLRAKFRALKFPATLVFTGEGVKDGSVDLSGDVRGQGASFREIASSLNGEIEFRNRDIRLTGGGLFLSTSNLFSILNPLAGGDRSVEARCALARFRINDGIADVTGLSARIGDTALLGEGKIDLKKEQLSLGIVPSSSSIGVSTLVPPLKIFGPMTGPTIVPNPLGIATASIDRVQSLFSRGVRNVRKSATGIGEFAGVLEKKERKPRSSDRSCDRIIEQNARQLTTMVGSLVFGTSPLPPIPPAVPTLILPD